MKKMSMMSLLEAREEELGHQGRAWKAKLEKLKSKLEKLEAESDSVKEQIGELEYNLGLQAPGEQFGLFPSDRLGKRYSGQEGGIEDSLKRKEPINPNNLSDYEQRVYDKYSGKD